MYEQVYVDALMNTHHQSPPTSKQHAYNHIHTCHTHTYACSITRRKPCIAHEAERCTLAVTAPRAVTWGISTGPSRRLSAWCLQQQQRHPPSTWTRGTQAHRACTGGRIRGWLCDVCATCVSCMRDNGHYSWVSLLITCIVSCSEPPHHVHLRMNSTDDMHLVSCIGVLHGLFDTARAYMQEEDMHAHVEMIPQIKATPSREEWWQQTSSCHKDISSQQHGALMNRFALMKATEFKTQTIYWMDYLSH